MRRSELLFCPILSAINIQYARCNINHYDHYSSRTDNSHKCSGFHSFPEFQFLSYKDISYCQRNACDSQCKTCIKAIWHACYSYGVLAFLQVKAYKVTENLVIGNSLAVDLYFQTLLIRYLKNAFLSCLCVYAS